ncbi:MAG: MFS transporter [Myxococcota bacterium]
MDGRSQQALGLLCAAQFMLVLDASIVAVALPSLQLGLEIPDRDLQYTITLYALTYGGFLVLGGRIADRWGRRRTFMTGLAAFGLASLGCGLAPSATALLVARAVQGAGAALTSPAALALLLDRFGQPDERTAAIGAWGAVSAAGGAAGLVAGGVLTDTLGWRSVFLINVPVCLVGISLAPRWLQEARGPREPLDLLGAVLVTAGLASLLFGLTALESQGLDAGSSGGALLAASVLLTAFAARLISARHPLVPLALFRRGRVTAANLTAATLAALIAAQNFFGSLTLQRVFGLSALLTGLAILPVTLFAFAGSAMAGTVERRLGRPLALAGSLAGMGVGFALLSGLSAQSSPWSVVPGFSAFGLGLGVGFVLVTEAATEGVDANLRGLASGMVNT